MGRGILPSSANVIKISGQGFVGPGPASGVQTFGPGTFSIADPGPGVVALRFKLWAGGGGGASGQTAGGATAGGGGGGGAFADVTVLRSAITFPLTLQVGAAGVGGVGVGVNGTNGGLTQVSSGANHALCNGGAGGQVGTSGPAGGAPGITAPFTTNATGNGGAGGTASNSTNGGPGGNATNVQDGPGGGGGGAGNTTFGSFNGGVGGTGAAPGGNAGVAGSGGNPGTNGSPGAGGGGGGGSVTGTPGAGANATVAAGGGAGGGSTSGGGSSTGGNGGAGLAQMTTIPATIGLDTISPSFSGSGSSFTLTLSTTKQNDIIIVPAFVNGATVSSITSTSGLSFSRRATTPGPNVLEEWFAVAPSILSGEVITVHLSGAASAILALAFSVFGVANTAAPFDSNASLPKISAGGVAPIVSTTAPRTFIFGVMTFSIASPTPGAGWTSIFNAAGSFALYEYQQEIAAQTNLTIAVGTGAGLESYSIGDALAGA